VITESIDPEARVIFGTIKDDNLNKGEIKVTLIATEFPNRGDLLPSERGAHTKPSTVFTSKKEAPQEKYSIGRRENTLIHSIRQKKPPIQGENKPNTTRQTRDPR